MVREALKKNKTAQDIFKTSRLVFALSFFWFTVPGVMLPGQLYVKLLMIQVYSYFYFWRSQRKLLNNRAPQNSQYDAEFLDMDKEMIGKTLRLYKWKLGFMKKNGMIKADYLSKDINSLCELIDKNTFE